VRASATGRLRSGRSWLSVIGHVLVIGHRQSTVVPARSWTGPPRTRWSPVTLRRWWGRGAPAGARVGCAHPGGGSAQVVDADVVDDHLLGEFGGPVGVTRPQTTHGDVEDHEERLVEHPLVVADVGGGDGVVGDVVDEPGDAFGAPLDRVHVEVVGEGTTFGVIVGSTDAFTPGVTGAVNGAVDST